VTGGITATHPPIIYGLGPVCLSVCYPADMDIDALTALINLQEPTGIASDWHPADDAFFADGVSPNPCPCEDSPARLHRLYVC
jgi:hypothetical protein